MLPEVETLQEVNMREIFSEVLKYEFRTFCSGTLTLKLAEFREDLRADMHQELIEFLHESLLDELPQTSRTTTSTGTGFSRENNYSYGQYEAKGSKPGSKSNLEASPTRAAPDLSIAGARSPINGSLVKPDTAGSHRKRPVQGCELPGAMPCESKQMSLDDDSYNFKIPSGLYNRATVVPMDDTKLDAISQVSDDTPLTPLAGSPCQSPRLVGVEALAGGWCMRSSVASIEVPKSSYFQEALKNEGAGMSGSKKSRDGKPSRSSYKSKILQQQIMLRSQLGQDNAGMMYDLRQLWSGEMNLEEFVSCGTFDNLSGFIILVNAVTIGLQTDIMARDVTDVVPGYLEVADKVIAACFLIEILLRMIALRCRFFTQPGLWRWNVLDCIMVGTQLVEELMRVIVVFSVVDFSNLKVMRVLRVLRLIRVIRVVRIMRLVSELRTIVASVLGSLKALMWTVALLVMFMYMVAVYFTQTITDYRVAKDSADVSEAQEKLSSSYGSLGRTILTLYEAISGGADWNDYSGPLFDEISSFVGAIFVFYIAFSVLCIMNVVTGVFVESALKHAQQEDSNFMEKNLRRIFESTDLDDNGTLEWDEFEACVETMEMQEFMRSIDLDPNEAVKLYKLIDVEEKGSVMLEDFVSQCSRLRGNAKSVDLMTVLFEMRHFVRAYLQLSASSDQRVKRIEKLILTGAGLAESGTMSVSMKDFARPSSS